MAGFNIREYIAQKITDLDAIGNKQAAVEYFKPVAPDLTRAKLTAMVKKQSFPAEFMEHVLSQDMEGNEDKQPPPPVAQPAKTTGPIAAPIQPMAGQQPSEEELAERGMAYEEGDGPDLNGTDPNMPLMPSAGAPLRRTSDMRVVNPLERVMPAAGPVAVAAPELTYEQIAQEVMDRLYSEGRLLDEPIAANGQPQPAVVTRAAPAQRPMLRRPIQPTAAPIVVDETAPTRQAGAIRYNTKSGFPPFRGWNESKQAFDVRMANGG